MPACDTMPAPTSGRTTGCKASIRKPGRTPASRQRPASAAHGGKREAVGFDRASRPPRRAGGREKRCRTGGRNRRRRAPPPAPAWRPTAGIISRSVQAGRDGLSRIAWKVSHSETKPFSGGRAEMAAQPTRTNRPLKGIRFKSPPSRPMPRSPVAVSTAPAPKNSRLLNREWLSTWSSAAVIASAAAPGKRAGLESQRQAERDEDHADVLDGANRPARASGPIASARTARRARRSRRRRRAPGRAHHHAPVPAGRRRCG